MLGGGCGVPVRDKARDRQAIRPVFTGVSTALAFAALPMLHERSCIYEAPARGLGAGILCV
jgi:hypothetical protein